MNKREPPAPYPRERARRMGAFDASAARGALAHHPAVGCFGRGLGSPSSMFTRVRRVRFGGRISDVSRTLPVARRVAQLAGGRDCSRPHAFLGWIRPGTALLSPRATAAKDHPVSQTASGGVERRRRGLARTSGTSEVFSSRLASSAGDVTADATTMTVATGEGAYFRPGDVVRVPRTGEALRIVAVLGDTVTSMVRGFGSQRAAAMTAGDRLAIVADARGPLGSRIFTRSGKLVAVSRPRRRLIVPRLCGRPRARESRGPRRRGRGIRSSPRKARAPDDPEPEPPDLVAGRARGLSWLRGMRGVVVRVPVECRVHACLECDSFEDERRVAFELSMRDVVAEVGEALEDLLRELEARREAA